MRLRHALPITALLLSTQVHADQLDDLVRAEMQKRQIPGLSLAIIENGKIVKAKGYGVTEKGGKVAVTPATRFMAGSVSKPVSAVGALHLVEQGKLSLDEDVNQKLLAWKVPENTLTAEQKVTLRRLLSHTAGLTVHGFPGYATTQPVPSVVQVLNGEAPANTAPVRVDLVPGSQLRYSGGGYTVMQQLLVDVSGMTFPELMHKTVLAPFGMRDSSFQQPPKALAARMFTTGHYGDRSLVKGRWHVYPEMAAAGLWTHPSDLARFAIGIQRSLAGKANPAMSAAMTRQMLTDQKGGFGLGLALKDSGKALRFSHNGRDEGFDTALSAFAETGQGAVIMINANDNSRMIERLMTAIGNQYHWPDAPGAPVIASPAPLPERATRESQAGRYEIANNVLLTLVANDRGLVTVSDGLPDDQFVPTGKDSYQSESVKRTLTFARDEHGNVTGFVLTDNGKERSVPRVAPLLTTLSPQADPDAQRSKHVQATLAALAVGGDTLGASSALTAGVKKAIGTSGVPELAPLRALGYLSQRDLAGQGIERHGSMIDTVLLYKVDNAGGRGYLMVYLDSAGLVGDYDLVDN